MLIDARTEVCVKGFRGTDDRASNSVGGPGLWSQGRGKQLETTEKSTGT